MKVWLVQTTVEDEYYEKEDEVKKFDNEQGVLNFVGSVAKGDYNRITVNGIYRVDLGYSPPKVSVLELVLENFKMSLREK